MSETFYGLNLTRVSLRIFLPDTPLNKAAFSLVLKYTFLAELKAQNSLRMSFCHEARWRPVAGVYVYVVTCFCLAWIQIEWQHSKQLEEINW